MSDAVIAPLSPDAGRHFRTDHLQADLKGRSIRGGAYTVGGQAIKFILQLGSTAILARLLTPADFGLVAMVAAFTGFVALFKDLGLSAATVQSPQITHEQVSALFWINVLASIAIAVICAALAPAVAWFYAEPRLFWITIVVSSSLVFAGLGAQHTALLARQMRFGSLVAIQIISLVVSIIVAVALALVGAKYWALVAMSVTQALGAVVGLWLACRWWPGLPRRRSRVLPMLKYGGNITGFSILDYLTRNLDNVLVGAVLGAAPLGIYSKAYNILMMPIYQFTGPITAVAQPALCRLQNDPVRYRKYFLRAVEILALLGMPIVVFTFVRADDLVRILLGQKWMLSVPVYRWLGPAAFLGTLNAAPGWLCTSLGYPGRQLRWGLFATPIIVAGFVTGLHWGAAGVAAGFSLTWSWLFLIFIAYACHGSPVRLSAIALTLWRPIFVSLVAGLVTALCEPFVHFSPHIIRVLVGAGVYGFAYVGIFMLLPAGPKTLLNLVSIVAQLRSERA